MPVHEIRETIDLLADFDASTKVFQKRINLQSGMRHNINHMDWFDDQLTALSNTNVDFKMQVYLTNYPVLLTDADFHDTNGGKAGPLAGDDQVLFKAQRIVIQDGSRTFVETQEFPNSFLGSSPTFTFYTPVLYFTVIITDEDWTEAYNTQIQQSIYLSVTSEEVGAVEYGIGMLREYSDNQSRVLTYNGITIDQADVTGGLPMWQLGGIRPEIMADTTSTGFASPFFLDIDDQGEQMLANSAVRAAALAGKRMVGSDQAFGTQSASLGGAPDWFASIVKNFPGMFVGPARSQFPPVVKNDNGNTEMV